MTALLVLTSLVDSLLLLAALLLTAFTLSALTVFTFAALPTLSCFRVVAVQFSLALLILRLHLLKLCRSVRVVRVAVGVHLNNELAVLLLQLLVVHAILKILHSYIVFKRSFKSKKDQRISRQASPRGKSYNMLYTNVIHTRSRR